MPDNIKNKILLVGTGPMAVTYAKVLAGMQLPFVTVGRGEQSADRFLTQTGVQPITGGLDNFLSANSVSEYTHVIISTGVEALIDNLRSVLKAGLKNILIEKPAAVSVEVLKANEEVYKENAETIFVAYNRRFYASVKETLRLIEEDGGLRSMNFEFTEWVHKIDPSLKSLPVLNNWFYANSSHVVDLAFFIAGEPVDWNAFSQKGTLAWHEKTNFAGAGVTQKGALFSYLSNWESAGRWAVELLTDKRRIYLKPLEDIAIQWKGKIELVPHPFDNSLDTTYKPGLYKQVEAFINSRQDSLINIADHLTRSETVFNKILGIGQQ